jgi:hypothetical protein
VVSESSVSVAVVSITAVSCSQQQVVVSVITAGVVVWGVASCSAEAVWGVGYLLSGPIRGLGFACGWVHPPESKEQRARCPSGVWNLTGQNTPIGDDILLRGA